MNAEEKQNCLRALTLAKNLIEHGRCAMICFALVRIQERDPYLNIAINHLRSRIEHELEECATLSTWVCARYLNAPVYMHGYATLCRMAWIDRMMEDYK